MTVMRRNWDWFDARSNASNSRPSGGRRRRPDQNRPISAARPASMGSTSRVVASRASVRAVGGTRPRTASSAAAIRLGSPPRPGSGYPTGPWRPGGHRSGRRAGGFGARHWLSAAIGEGGRGGDRQRRADDADDGRILHGPLVPDGAVPGDAAKRAAHDGARLGVRPLRHDVDLLRFGDGPDLRGDVVTRPPIRMSPESTALPRRMTNARMAWPVISSAVPTTAAPTTAAPTTAAPTTAAPTTAAATTAAPTTAVPTTAAPTTAAPTTAAPTTAAPTTAASTTAASTTAASTTAAST